MGLWLEKLAVHLAVRKQGILYERPIRHICCGPCYPTPPLFQLQTFFESDCSFLGYGGYGHDQYGPKCEEISQKSCYNQPKVEEVEKDVVLVLPEPQLKCTQKTIKVPEVTCKTKAEHVCINVPRIVQQPTTVQKCVPELAGEKCDHIVLTLPKQVCKDLIVGDAHPVPKYPPPRHYSN